MGTGGGPPNGGGEQQDMTIGEWEGGNKTSLHMVIDMDVPHK
jgi:hypothetical protein